MAIYGLDPDAECADADLETLCWQKEMFETLLYQTTVKGEELENEWRLISERSKNLIEESIRIMGEYIRKLNLSVLSTSQGINTGSNGAPGHYVVIVDSAKYPQTADHIRKAQKMGFPEFVSLDRSHAADRRSVSLAHVKANPEKDRDEWPMAVFKEGGAGANVMYVDASDNRGAGAAIGWQMRNFPDGSRIRVRVI